MVDLALAQAEVDPERIVLVGRSFGGLLAPRGASGEPRLAALVADPGQYDMAETLSTRLGDLWNRVDDPAASDEFESLLQLPGLTTLFGPRMTTHGITTVQSYVGEMRNYNSRDQAPSIRCPSFITDNETDPISTGQGQRLFDALTCPKEFRRFTKAEGAEGHCEGMAPTVFWAAAFDWLASILPDQSGEVDRWILRVGVVAAQERARRRSFVSGRRPASGGGGRTSWSDRCVGHAVAPSSAWWGQPPSPSGWRPVRHRSARSASTTPTRAPTRPRPR